MSCEIAIGCYIMGNYLDTLGDITVFNTLVNGLDQRINGKPKFDEIVNSIKDYVNILSHNVLEEINTGKNNGGYDSSGSWSPPRFLEFLTMARGGKYKPWVYNHA